MRSTTRETSSAFQCSSASRKFLNGCCGNIANTTLGKFQCSSASRKFLNQKPAFDVHRLPDISVLFSEPKIPQSISPKAAKVLEAHFSALQRAENSSMFGAICTRHPLPRFQCSSASRKFLNWRRCNAPVSVGNISVLFSEPKIPQSTPRRDLRRPHRAISVLFSEPKIPQCRQVHPPLKPLAGISVLFSEPKIPQWCCDSSSEKLINISVLFSEPKIPQYPQSPSAPAAPQHFSALQRAENSSIGDGLEYNMWLADFSALQRAENSSIIGDCERPQPEEPNQCSSASRKFLNNRASARCTQSEYRRSVLFSEPKIPQ